MNLEQAITRHYAEQAEAEASKPTRTTTGPPATLEHAVRAALPPPRRRRVASR
ncbi:hypothetical protein [Actinomadura rugatobispora]|uniref:Uncharacterized protein n=1 Tax=Actinomadura rugatobispora TaxID=1994 RepID=A0ABW1A6N7_9ACTN